MSIQAKKEGLLRLIGMICIVIAIGLNLIFDFLITSCLPAYVILFSISIPWIAFIALMKLENEVIMEYLRYFYLFFIAYTIGLLIISRFACIPVGIYVNYLFIAGAYVLGLLTWHFSLSIFKIKKIVFLVFGIAYIVISLVFRMSLYNNAGILLFGIISIVFFSAGLGLVIFAEQIMKKKGLLNYV